MRKQIINTIVALSFAVLLSAASSQAQTHGKLKAHIPFAFYVQNQRFDAGDYTIESVNPQTGQTNLLIKRTDGTARRLVIMTPKEVNGRETQAALSFNRYGGDYILSEIRNPLENFGAELAASKTERNLARRLGPAKRETVAVK